MQLADLYKATKEQLTPQRYQHTLQVISEAKRLAAHYGADVEKAEVAAILHDYCKNWPAPNLREHIEQLNLPTELLSFNPELWHAPVAAEIVVSRFGISDQDILNAIRYHTTGRPDMSLLEKVIYLADYIEPGREFPEVNEVRKLALEDLDTALLQTFNNTIKFLIEKREKLFSETILARNHLLDQLNPSL